MRIPKRSIQLVMLLLVFLGGCTMPLNRPMAQTKDRAFILYWPPAENSGRPRLAVKDLIDLKGTVTTAGSEYFARHNRPAARDAKCLEIARSRNVQIVGKTNTTELAIAVTGINQYFGTPRNPQSRRRVIPGGSSSGSAVAVANHEADMAFGTDTAGSIRVPAACCGVVGLKTTFGLVPLDGVYPIAPQYLDTVGPIARDIKGAVAGMDLLQPGFSSNYRRAVAAKPMGQKIRIGRLYLDGTDSKLDRAVDDALAGAGFQVVKLKPEFAGQWVQAQKDATTVAAANAWLRNRQYLKEPQFSARTKAILTAGGIDYKTGYPEALRRRIKWQREVDKIFREVDIIALPTMQTLPPKLSLFGATAAFEARVLAVQNTAAVNLAGVPALAIPVPVRDRTVPYTSLQLVGPRRSEAALLNAGRLVEASNRARAE